MSLDAIVSVQDREPVQPSYFVSSDASLVASALDLLTQANAGMPEARQIPEYKIKSVIARERGDDAQIMRAVFNYIDTVQNPKTGRPTVHTDLLPAGHPLSRFTTTREQVAQYFASDPALKDTKIRTLVASAIAAEPNTVERAFHVHRILAHDGVELALGVIADADGALNV